MRTEPSGAYSCGRPSELTYVKVLKGRMKSVKKKEMTPHQPKKKVMSVYSQKYLSMHRLQS